MSAKKAGVLKDIEVRATDESATFTVHKALYPADVLFGTAFAFLDRCYVHLDVADKDRTLVELTVKPGHTVKAGDIAGEFKNELVTQALRLKLAKQTEEVRTMIVGRAIGGALPVEGPAGQPAPAEPDLPPEVAKILAEEDESLDFLDDPLGIAVPWEEKYGKKSGEGGQPAGKDAPSPGESK